MPSSLFQSRLTVVPKWPRLTDITPETHLETETNQISLHHCYQNLNILALHYLVLYI